MWASPKSSPLTECAWGPHLLHWLHVQQYYQRNIEQCCHRPHTPENNAGDGQPPRCLPPPGYPQPPEAEQQAWDAENAGEQTPDQWRQGIGAKVSAHGKEGRHRRESRRAARERRRNPKRPAAAFAHRPRSRCSFSPGRVVGDRPVHGCEEDNDEHQEHRPRNPEYEPGHSQPFRRLSLSGQAQPPDAQHQTGDAEQAQEHAPGQRCRPGTCAKV